MDVLIASGQPNLRFSLEVFLRQQPGIVIIGTVSNAASLLAIVYAARPNLVIMDWELPGCSPVEVLSEVKAAEYPPQVIILGKDLSASQAAIDAGADGFLLQGDYPTNLLAIIRRVGLSEPAAGQSEEEE
jgi:DNA-binding NarL/FixJ family response regulator